jgi:hypothetical protein
MKTLLAISCVSACALLVGCGGDSDVQTISADQVRKPTSEPVPPPGSDVKLGSNNSAGGQAAPPKKPAGE